MEWDEKLLEGFDGEVTRSDLPFLNRVTLVAILVMGQNKARDKAGEDHLGNSYSNTSRRRWLDLGRQW